MPKVRKCQNPTVTSIQLQLRLRFDIIVIYNTTISTQQTFEQFQIYIGSSNFAWKHSLTLFV